MQKGITTMTSNFPCSKAAVVARVAQLLKQAEAGDFDRLAMRLFRVDGTWEDIAVGGSPEWQEAARAKLQAADDRPLVDQGA